VLGGYPFPSHEGQGKPLHDPVPCNHSCQAYAGDFVFGSYVLSSKPKTKDMVQLRVTAIPEVAIRHGDDDCVNVLLLLQHLAVIRVRFGLRMKLGVLCQSVLVPGRWASSADLRAGWIEGRSFLSPTPRGGVYCRDCVGSAEMGQTALPAGLVSP